MQKQAAETQSPPPVSAMMPKGQGLDSTKCTADRSQYRRKTRPSVPSRSSWYIRNRTSRFLGCHCSSYLIRVLVPHAQPLHDPAASRIADVMRRSQIGDAVPPYLFDDRPSCLCGDPPVPEFPAEPVAEIVAVI